MIHRPLEQVTKVDIDALVENGVREIRTLDFKEELPGPMDEAKCEILADVSSFANASGGNLLFGVREEDGVAVEALGLPGKIDDAIQRLENLARDGLSPRLPALQTKIIDGFQRGPVLLIRISQSWASPHMVTFKNLSRFYTRNNAGKYQLDVAEIRAAFAQSEALQERIKRFRDDRIAKVVADETPVPLSENPKIILHLIPNASVSARVVIAPSVMYQHRSLVVPFSASGWNQRMNIDGLISHSGPRDNGRYDFYCQAFRNGIIESVDARLIRAGERNIIPATAFARELIEALEAYLRLFDKFALAPPLFVTCTLLGVNGFALAASRDWAISEPSPVDRDVLTLPDVMIESADDLPSQVRPMLDGLWNAGGYQQCQHYDPEGVWNPQS